MTEVFSLANLILSNADRLSLFIVVVALISEIYIAIANYKKEIWEYITNVLFIRNRGLRKRV